MCYYLIERAARHHGHATGTMLYDPNTHRQLKEPTGRWLLGAYEFRFVTYNSATGR